MRRAAPGYDLVVFGWLDSQALFSSMSNVRLDGYVYTVESMRAALGLLADDGLLALSFSVRQPWLIEKLIHMVDAGTGRRPLVYFDQNSASLILLVKGHGALTGPATWASLRRIDLADAAPDYQVVPPSDDWPFLYLSEPRIPKDYLAVVTTLLVLSVTAILALGQRGRGWSDLHFVALGFGFMLLETRGIRDCTLYFGATWFVTWVVVTGVLLMVLLANTVSARLARFRPLYYVPLLAVLALLYLTPPDVVLAWDFSARLAWALLIMPLPIFFAGLVFSTTLRTSVNPAASFGANLIGAVMGGFSEYLAMVTGNKSLLLLVATAYLLSLACQLRSRGAALPGVA